MKQNNGNTLMKLLAHTSLDIDYSENVGSDSKLELDKLNIYPIDPNDLYLKTSHVLVDQGKWESHWKKSHKYVPDPIENYFSSDRDDPLLAHKKSQNKIENIYKNLSISGGLHSPIICPFDHQFRDGRHRHWVLRALGVKSFIAAIYTADMRVIKQCDYILQISDKTFTTKDKVFLD